MCVCVYPYVLAAKRSGGSVEGIRVCLCVCVCVGVTEEGKMNIKKVD